MPQFIARYGAADGKNRNASLALFSCSSLPCFGDGSLAGFWALTVLGVWLSGWLLVGTGPNSCYCIILTAASVPTTLASPFYPLTNFAHKRQEQYEQRVGLFGVWTSLSVETSRRWLLVQQPSVLVGILTVYNQRGRRRIAPALKTVWKRCDALSFSAKPLY